MSIELDSDYEMDQPMPKKFSTVLKWCVEDLNKCILDPRLEIDMAYWVSNKKRFKPEVRKDGKCSVCMAGAIMMKRSTARDLLDGIGVISVKPGNFNMSWMRLFHAIDYARDGQWKYAVRELVTLSMVASADRDKLIEGLEADFPGGFHYYDVGEVKFFEQVNEAIAFFEEYEGTMA